MNFPEKPSCPDQPFGLQHMLQTKLEEMNKSHPGPSPLSTTQRGRSFSVSVAGKLPSLPIPKSSSRRGAPRSFTKSVGRKHPIKLVEKTDRVGSLLDPPSSPRLNNFSPRLRKEQDKKSSTLEMQNAASHSAKNHPACVVVNPLNSYDPILTEENLKEHLPTLFALSVKGQKFCTTTAVQEVLKCIQYHSGFAMAISSLLEIKEQVQEDRRINKRWDRFLTALFLHPQSAPFLIAYIKASGEDVNHFATRVTARICKQEEKVDNVILALYLLTTEELKEQQAGTLFRSASLSSSLCTQYGSYLLKNQMAELENIVWKEFELAKERLEISESEILRQKEGLHYLLSVEPKVLKEEMKKRVKDYESLDYREQLDFADRRLLKNAPYFKDFAKGLLNKLYNLSLPKDFCSLLQMRRKAIEEKFGGDGEVFCGELLCLRILCPGLTEIPKISPLERNVLKNVSGVLQKLSNQVEFDESKNAGPLLSTLQELYDELIEQHRSFVNKHSLATA